MLSDFTNKIKAVPRDDWVVAAIILLVALLAFGLGRLSVLYGGEEEFKIEYPDQQASVIESQDDNSELKTQNSELPTSGGFVASKTGSKYHLPWCAGAQSIKEENKIYFATKVEAEARGYAPAANCKGL